jgi:hypothetical protein
MQLRVWVAGILASASAAVLADDSSIKLWLNPGLYSHHFRGGNYREDNYGVGVEVARSPQHAFMAGSFINSDRERSRYAGYYWRPWHWQRAGVDIGAGVMVALIDGYSTTNNGRAFPAAVPALSAEYGYFGANLAFIPHPRNGAALALQLKLRVW